MLSYEEMEFIRKNFPSRYDEVKSLMDEIEQCYHEMDELRKKAVGLEDELDILVGKCEQPRKEY